MLNFPPHEKRLPRQQAGCPGWEKVVLLSGAATFKPSPRPQAMKVTGTVRCQQGLPL